MSRRRESKSSKKEDFGARFASFYNDKVESKAIGNIVFVGNTSNKKLAAIPISPKRLVSISSKHPDQNYNLYDVKKVPGVKGHVYLFGREKHVRKFLSKMGAGSLPSPTDLDEDRISALNENFTKLKSGEKHIDIQTLIAIVDAISDSKVKSTVINVKAEMEYDDFPKPVVPVTKKSKPISFSGLGKVKGQVVSKFQFLSGFNSETAPGDVKLVNITNYRVGDLASIPSAVRIRRKNKDRVTEIATVDESDGTVVFKNGYFSLANFVTIANLAKNKRTNPFDFTYLKVSKGYNFFRRYVQALQDLFDLSRADAVAKVESTYEDYQKGTYSDSFKELLRDQYNEYMRSAREEEEEGGEETTTRKAGTEKKKERTTSRSASRSTSRSRSRSTEEEEEVKPKKKTKAETKAETKTSGKRGGTFEESEEEEEESEQESE